MKIINPNEIGSKISTLIVESNKKFCAVTPYLDLSKWKKILISLDQAVKRGVKIKFYFREIRDKDFRVLNNLGIELIKIDGLHTKLYFNENEVIVSSMNLYEFSDLYSIDIALYFDGQEEYNKIYNYFIKYIDSKNTEKYTPQSFKDELKQLHFQLEERYVEKSVKKASDYIFSTNLIPIFHLFIDLHSITLKYPKKDYKDDIIKELETNIKDVLDCELIPLINDNRNYFYWDIKIENNNFLKTTSIISALNNIIVPESISKKIIINPQNFI